MAESLAQQGKLAAALGALQEVVQREPNHPRAWFLLAKFSIQGGEARRAIDDYLVRALVIQSKLRNEQGRGDVLNAFGVAYQELGDVAQAAEYYEQAAEIRRRIGDRRGTATSLKNLAMMNLIRGEAAAAERNLAASLAILDEIGDKTGIAELYNAFGSLEEERGAYAQALDYYRRALHIRHDLGDRRAIAESLNNVGYASYLLGDYDNAAVYLEQAAELYRTSKDRDGVLLTTQSLGVLQIAQGRWEEATKSFLAALEEGRSLGKRDAMAVSFGYLGLVSQNQGRYAAAVSSYAEALKILRELGDKRGLCEFTLYEAEVDSELGLLDEAGEAITAAGGWLAEGGNREQRATLLTLQGEWRLRRGEPEAARKAFSDALVEAEASHGIVAELRAKLGLARAELARGDSVAGGKRLRAAEQQVEKVGHAVLRLRVAEALAGYQLGAGRLAEAEAAVRGALRVVRGCGGWGGEFRLHHLLSRILAARGAAAEAVAEAGQAASLLEQVRRGLNETQRAAFDHLPEVVDVTRAVPSGGRGVGAASSGREALDAG